MRANDSLFLLIKSLSQSEKRFFRLEASKYSSKELNEYLKLYEIIDRQEQYDEDGIKKNLYSKENSKKLPGTKNYLFNMIVKALTQYHSEKNSHLRISELLQQVDVLFGKGLYKPAAKLLSKAAKIADNYQRLNYQIMISEWEHKFADLEDKFWKTQKKMSEIQLQEQRQSDTLNLKLKIEKLHEEVVTYMYTKGQPRDEEEKAVYSEFLKNPVLIETEYHEHIYIQNLHHSLVGLCYYMSLNREQALVHAQKRVKLLELNEDILAEDNHEYAIAIFNYLQILTIDKQVYTAFEQLKKVLAFLKKPDLWLEERSKVFFILVEYYHSTNVHLMLGNFEEVAKIGRQLKQKEKEIFDMENKNRLMFIIPINLAIANITLGHYTEALHWLRLVLNDTSNAIRSDSLAILRILHLIVQYELGNLAILEYYIESTQRFLAEHNKLQKFERTLLGLIRQLANTPKWDSNYVELFVNARKKLLHFAESESHEKINMEHAHLLEWIESKIEQKPMLEIVLKKIENQKQYYT